MPITQTFPQTPQLEVSLPIEAVAVLGFDRVTEVRNPDRDPMRVDWLVTGVTSRVCMAHGRRETCIDYRSSDGSTGHHGFAPGDELTVVRAVRQSEAA